MKKLIITSLLIASTLFGADFGDIPIALTLGGSQIPRRNLGDTDFEAINTPTGAIVGTSDTQTLSNKWVQPRVITITSSATPAVNSDLADCVTITALATNITSMSSSLSGSPMNFQKLVYRIKDNGSPHTIAWGNSFASSGATLPTTTVAGKTTTVGFIWDSVQTKWICLALDQQP